MFEVDSTADAGGAPRALLDALVEVRLELVTDSTAYNGSGLAAG
jgi:hypothetical protein